MLNTYVIAYDISEDKRRRRIYSCLRGWGEPIQYSVFQASLSSKQLAMLRIDLHGIVHHDEDQVLIFDLGPTLGRARDAVSFVGSSFTPLERQAVVV